jgi:hypothetical protein
MFSRHLVNLLFFLCPMSGIQCARPKTCKLKAILPWPLLEKLRVIKLVNILSDFYGASAKPEESNPNTQRVFQHPLQYYIFISPSTPGTLSDSCLGAFAKLRKATISFAVCVLSSAWNNSAPQSTNLHEIRYLSILRNYVGKILFIKIQQE